MQDHAELATVTQTRYRCRHLHASGAQCGSPALRNESFCYHHHTTRRPKVVARPRQPDEPQPFDLPLVEDRASALAAASRILQLLAANDIELPRAGKLLHNLQLITKLLPREPDMPTPPAPFHDAVDDEVHGLIAPITELQPVPEASLPAQRSSLSPQSRIPASASEAPGAPQTTPRNSGKPPIPPHSSAPLSPQQLRQRLTRSARHRNR